MSTAIAETEDVADAPELLVRQLAAEAARISEPQVDAMFVAAGHYFAEGQYVRAGRIFALLSCYRPKDPRHLEAIALCSRKLEDYDHAVHFFARALEIVPQRLDMAIQLVECMLIQGRKEIAAVILLGVAKQANDENNDAAYNQALGMLELLDRE